VAAINMDMDSMRQWQQGVFQADRPTELVRLSETSWSCLVQRVNEFMGYMWHVQGQANPRLVHYLHATAFVHFISFLQSRGLNKPSLLKATHAAIRVVSWLGSRAALEGGGNTPRCEKVGSWLQNMHTQLRCNLQMRPKLNHHPEALKEQGKWMDAPNLVLRVDGVRAQAVAGLASLALSSSMGEEQQQQQQQDVSEVEVAGWVHDALFACMCFGYMPPLRSSTLISLTFSPPGGVAQPCMHPDCQQQLQAAGCLGNRVHQNPTNGKWMLDVVHHKNSSRWGGNCGIRVELPVDLGELLQYHTSRGQPLLLEQVTDVPGMAAQSSLFLNTSQARPLLMQEASTLFSTVVLEGSGCHFGPQTCRSIYVVGSRDLAHSMPSSTSSSAAPCAACTQPSFIGPGAAMVMGNKLDVWNSVYDRHFPQRQASEAMRDMEGWRRGMLQQASQMLAHPQPQQQSQPRMVQQLAAPPPAPHTAHTMALTHALGAQQQQQQQQANPGLARGMQVLRRLGEHMQDVAIARQYYRQHGVMMMDLERGCGYV